MATYIKGMTDYIPQIQPWSPDYNFYQSALDRKQKSYDRGWEQTNTIYNSILNAPMMREQNVERRDNFFQEIEAQIQQMSTVDLSLQQNVDAAASVFKPFYENEDIVHDIAYTRKYQDQIQHADYLKNCTDKEKCGGKYWAGGKRLLQHKANDFINATDDEALRMQAPSYTNYVNFMDKATKAIDEVGKGQWEMVTDEIKGGYKIRTKNGQQQIGTLQNFMMARFGDDPEVNEYYGAKAELMSYEDPEKLINMYEIEKLRSEATSEEELQGLIKERAERKKFDAAVTTIDKKAKDEKAELESMTSRRDILYGIITSEGVLPGSKEAKQYSDLENELPTKQAAVKKAEQASSYVQNMQYIDEDGNRIPTSVINNVVANAMLMNDIGRTAKTLAYRDYSVTMEADAYALANYKNQLDIARDDRTAERTNAESTIKYIRERGADDNATKLEIARRDAIDALTIGKGMRYKGTTYKGLSNADALTVYRELFAHKNNTGVPYYDGYDGSSGTTTEEGAKADTKLQTALDKAFNGSEEEGDNAAGAIDDANNLMYSDAFVNLQNAHEQSTQFVNQKMTGLIQKVLTPGASDQKIAGQGLLLIGDMIAEAQEKNTPFYKQLKQAGVWDKYFKEFPNSETRYTNGTDALAKLNIDGAIGYISALVGNDKIVDLLNNKDVQITVMDKKDPTLIDTEALGVISHEEANRLMNKDVGGDINDFNDTNTDEEKEALALYLNKTDSIKAIPSENFLHTLITDQDAKTLTEIAWNKKNAQGMMNSLNKSIDLVAKTYGEYTDGEKDGVMRSFMRKNIIQKPKPDIRKTSTRQDMYNAAAAEGVELLKVYSKENITAGIQPSIAELEGDSDYASKDGKPLLLQGDALRGVISTADMPVEIGEIDFTQLYQDNNIPIMLPGEIRNQGKTGWSTAGTEKFNHEPMWSTLIDDPNTQIVREGDKVMIRSPYLKTQSNGILLDTDDIEVNEGVQDMFNDINDQYANVVRDYGQLMQHVPDKPEYLVYGTGGDFTGSYESNYNITSRTATGIQLVPNDKIPAYNDYIQLFKEAQSQLGDINFAEYGMNKPAGNPKFLNDVILALEDTYKDGKNMPIFDIDYTPVAGSENLTRVHISLNSYKAQDWVKAIGEEITGIRMPDQEGDLVDKITNTIIPLSGLSGGSYKGSKIPTEGTYYIENSKSRIIEKSKSNSYHNVMANIPVGEFYLDDSQKSKYGGVIQYVRESRNKIKAYMIYPEYNWDNDTTYDRTQLIGEWPLIGTNWESRVDFNNAELKVKQNILKEAYKKYGAYVTDPSKL